MINDEVRVKIADYKITQAPNKLITVGLGSCIGTLVYDERTKIAGLSHIMLPDSTAFTNQTTLNIAKFADSALPKMVAELKKQAPNGHFKAKIVGGANMFNFQSQANSLNIGQRNITAVEAVLKKLRIPVIAKHVGGNSGRTMIVDLAADFDTTVRIVHHDVVHI